MGCYHHRCYQEHRLVWFFFTQKIGEYAYGFSSDEEEEISGDSLTVYGSTIIADASDFIRAFPQYTLDDYLYRLSCAQIQFLAVDNTHTKYLQGSDKKVWENYKEALNYFDKAIAAGDNMFAATYMLKAGVVCEQLGDNAKALSYYKTIKDKYPQSMEGYDIDKYISRIESAK